MARSTAGAADTVPIRKALAPMMENLGLGIPPGKAPAALLKSLRQLIASGDAAALREISRPDKKGVSALVFAAAFGQADIVAALLGAGASPDVKGPMDERALTIAARLGHAGIVDALLDAGANPNLNDDDNSPLKTAITDGNVAIVKSFIRAKARLDIRLKHPDGPTPLGLASKQGEAEIAELLLEAGADVNAPSARGRTPLMAAAAQGHRSIVETLLAAGADRTGKDPKSQTALDLATAAGHRAIAELLKNPRQGKRKLDGVADILSAADAGDIPRMKAALAAGVPVDATDEPTSSEDQRGGMSALMRASERGDVDAVKFLLAAGASVNLTSDAATFAVRSGLHHAVEAGHAAVVDLLIAAGADVDARESTLEDPGKTGHAPLHLAARAGHAAIAAALIRAGADVKRKGAGQTALHAAAAEGHPKLVRILLEAGADANAKDNAGATPLVAAADALMYQDVDGRDFPDVARLLLAAGGSRPTADLQKRTALAKLKPRGKKPLPVDQRLQVERFRGLLQQG